MGRRISTGTAGTGGGIGSLLVISNVISTAVEDDDLILDPSGTGKVLISDVTVSSSTTTGALVVNGGLGMAGNLYVGGNIEGTGTINGGSF